MPNPKIPGAVLLGPGKSYRYWKPEYAERLLEEGGETWLLPEGFFCRFCDGCGCVECGWTGEEGKRQERFRHQHSARKKVLKSGSAQAAASSSHSPTGHGPPTDADKPDT